MVDLNDDVQSLSEKYDFLEEIGAGSMGVIYKARHKILNKVYAIKLMQLHTLSPAAVKRFEIEGKATSSLSHPNIVQVHDFGTAGSGHHPYMVMEFVEGTTLEDLLSDGGQIPVERFFAIFEQVCLGLSHAHEHGIVHRDIKPSNIMITRTETGQEQVRIMDFGIAKMLFDESSAPDLTKWDLTKTGETVGSPLYMSPEQARGLKVDQRSDLYSVGCVMYEALTGDPPFVGKTPQETLIMHVKQNPLSLRMASMGKEFDPGLESLIGRLLAKPPADRFASAAELRQALRLIQKQPGLMQTSGKAAEGAKTVSSLLPFVTSKNKQLALVGIALSLVCLVGVAGYFLTSAQRVSLSQASTSRRLEVSTVPDVSTVSSITSSSQARPQAVPKPNTTGDFDLVSAIPNFQEIGKDNRAKDNGLSMKGMVQDMLRDHSSRIDLDRALMREQLRDEDLEPLAGASYAREVILKNCPLITERGLRYVNKLKLTELDLGGTGIKTLETIKDMRSLTDLSCSQTNINREGLKSIRNLTALTNLDLRMTNIQDQDLPILYDLKLLRTLSLQECALTDTAIKSLRGQLPGCKVLFYRTATLGNRGNSVPLVIKDAKELEKIGQWQDALSQWRDARGALETYGGEMSEIAECQRHESFCRRKLSEPGQGGR